MTPAELTLAAALGASALTAGATLGVVALREWMRGRRDDRDALLTAVTAMLSRSMSVMMRAQALGQQLYLRSGLAEGLDVALRVRKPFDAQELYDWMAVDMAPLNEAWSAVWTLGDQEAIRLANALLAKCGDLISASTATDAPGTATGRLRRLVAGEKPTAELQADIDRAVKEVAHAREQLARHVRRRIGLPAVQLFGHEPATDASQPAALNGQEAGIPAADASGEPANSDSGGQASPPPADI